MMSATRVTTISGPVRTPASAPPRTSRSEKSERLAEAHVTIHRAATTLTRLISEPIERSIPPEMIAIACPQAANASGSASIATRLDVERPPRQRGRSSASRGRGRRAARRRRPSSRAAGAGGGVELPAGRADGDGGGRSRCGALLLDEAVHRAQERRLVGRRAGQLGRDPAAVERERRGRRRAGTRRARSRRRGSRRRRRRGCAAARRSGASCRRRCRASGRSRASCGSPTRASARS